MPPANEILHEERIIVRQELMPNGDIRVTAHIEGDSDNVDENEPISLAYAAAVSLFHLFQNGTVAKTMREDLGYRNVGGRVTLEVVE